ncbi:heterokaryon incompatibility protein-domain-containing protein [Annulohypoxylon truncatum]|uniref:heterokaryon incompatibility protein-domain-containing protein n=1 Tax=Annulohypoxylon truncatum TaxID=327061 RepID=UPI0020084FBE|nr:heterokaryon incompatibility protein-domain-containing protein [Annulohypoxylon truncatum]KAI1207073.1 heterokaryon incompatibility protein-domain-containing protein [Annulohypoxylon truncatum]
MRLLNTTTLELESFLDRRPNYAILSHTWGDEEILFEDVQNDPSRWYVKKGAAKVRGSCSRASKDGHRYIWIDTCCIDKTSSAELSESINSMFNWYAGADVCYAFLADAVKGRGISKCKWFARGWTLQELIAPKDVRFYDGDWQYLGDRLSLIEELVAITRIDRPILARNPPKTSSSEPPGLRTGVSMVFDSSLESMLETYTISRRMSWAAGRQTQREEDRAYSLMGLFGVNMPLLYGEGPKAFRRLQEEIVKESNDQSILAYRQHHLTSDIARLFSSDPDLFLSNIEQDSHVEKSQIYFSDGGLSVELTLCPCVIRNSLGSKPSILGILDCVVDSDYLSRPAFLLQQAYQEDESRYWRMWPTALYLLGPDHGGRAIPETLTNIGFKDVSFDISKAQTKRITLIETSREHDYKMLNARTLPLRLNEIRQPLHRYFVRDLAYPDQLGSFILPRRSTSLSNRPDPALGVMSFHEKGVNRFMLVWGSDSDEETGIEKPWCKVWPLKDILEYDNAADRDEVELTHEIIGLFQQHKAKRIRQLLDSKDSKQDTSYAVVDLEHKVDIQATISLVSFLGRHIFDLQVTIS